MSTTALYGAKAILRHLRTKHACTVTRKTLWRWSCVPADPFPIAYQVVDRRQRIVTDVRAVDAWVARNLATPSVTQ